jgi:hypothetical protein
MRYLISVSILVTSCSTTTPNTYKPETAQLPEPLETIEEMEANILTVKKVEVEPKVEGPKTVWFVKAETLNIYTRPEVNAKVVRTLPQGTPLLGQTSGRWVRLAKGEWAATDALSTRLIPRPQGKDFSSIDQPDVELQPTTEATYGSKPVAAYRSWSQDDDASF